MILEKILIWLKGDDIDIKVCLQAPPVKIYFQLKDVLLSYTNAKINIKNKSTRNVSCILMVSLTTLSTVHSQLLSRHNTNS